MARGDPGDHLINQVSNRLRHMPVSTRRTEAALLATEGEEHLVLIGVTGEIMEDGVQVCALNFKTLPPAVHHQPNSAGGGTASTTFTKAGRAHTGGSTKAPSPSAPATLPSITPACEPDGSVEQAMEVPRACVPPV